MEINVKIIVLILGVLCTGLTAGLRFSWSNAITPGIGRLDDLSFLKSFQAMNRAIITGKFLMVFFGPIMLLFFNAYFFKESSYTFWFFLIAAILIFVDIGLITVFKNVPLNELLDQTELDKASSLELADLRKTFKRPRNRWHNLLTVSSTLAFVLLLIGILINK